MPRVCGVGPLCTCKDMLYICFAMYERGNTYVLAAGNDCGNFREINSKNGLQAHRKGPQTAKKALTCHTSPSGTAWSPDRPVRPCSLPYSARTSAGQCQTSATFRWPHPLHRTCLRTYALVALSLWGTNVCMYTQQYFMLLFLAGTCNCGVPILAVIYK